MMLGMQCKSIKSYVGSQKSSDLYPEYCAVSKQERMYYWSGTGGIGAGRGFMYNTGWYHFSAWNDVMTAVLVWRHIGNPTPSIDVHLFEEHPCLISSRSDLKRRILRLFWFPGSKDSSGLEYTPRRRTTTTRTRWVAIWDQFLIKKS